MNIKRLKITTNYNLAIEGYPVSKYYDDFFNRWYINFKLSTPFAGYKKGDIISDHINSIILKK